jgi:hypothetical protein
MHNRKIDTIQFIPEELIQQVYKSLGHSAAHIIAGAGAEEPGKAPATTPDHHSPEEGGSGVDGEAVREELEGVANDGDGGGHVDDEAGSDVEEDIREDV